MATKKNEDNISLETKDSMTETTEEMEAAAAEAEAAVAKDNPVAAAEAKAAEIIAAAMAQAAAIKAEDASIKAKAEGNTEATNHSTNEELVTIRLFKDNEKYKDDVFVAVNGKAFQIKRGVEVQVPKFVYDVLMQSMDQDQATAELISEESGRYKSEAEARKL